MSEQHRDGLAPQYGYGGGGKNWCGSTADQPGVLIIRADADGVLGFYRFDAGALKTQEALRRIEATLGRLVEQRKGAPPARRERRLYVVCVMIDNGDREATVMVNCSLAVSGEEAIGGYVTLLREQRPGLAVKSVSVGEVPVRLIEEAAFLRLADLIAGLANSEDDKGRGG